MELVKHGVLWSDIVASKLEGDILEGTVDDALLFHDQFRVPPVSKDALTTIIPNVYEATKDLTANMLLGLIDGRKLETDGGVVKREHAPLSHNETITEITTFLQNPENVDQALTVFHTSLQVITTDPEALRERTKFLGDISRTSRGDETREQITAAIHNRQHSYGQTTRRIISRALADLPFLSTEQKDVATVNLSIVFVEPPLN